jgi:hypothetical protein
LQWASPDNIIGAKYYKYTQTSGKAPEYVWYDSYGREIVKQTYGLNKLISVTTEYNDKGLIKRVSEPYFEEDSGSKKWAASYLYDDDYNRVSSIITPQGTTTYTYDTYKTTVISPEETTITVFNGAGQNTEVCKNGHYVLYDYYASGKLKSSTPWGNTEGGGSDPIIMEYDLQGNRNCNVERDGRSSLKLVIEKFVKIPLNVRAGLRPDQIGAEHTVMLQLGEYTSPFDQRRVNNIS